jgi:CDP-glucose 4,6-dehydratase
LLLAEKLAGDRTLAGHAFNFSSDDPISVLDLVRMVLAAMDSSLEPDVRNQGTHEIRRQWLDSAKSRRVLGWQPLYTMEEGLALTIEWYRRRLGVAAALRAAA